ncbi:MAG: hypothetical protein ACQERF_11560 [Actinomycetota bacterium]
MIPAGISISVVALITGWAALWPLRRDLGTVGYHLMSVPVGLAGWSTVTGLTTVLDVQYTPVSVSAGLLLHAAIIAGVGSRFSDEGSAGRSGRRSARRPDRDAPPLWSYGAHLVLLVVLAATIAAAGYSVYGEDSWASYELHGMRIHDTGQVFESSMAVRNVLVPSIHAGNRFFGGEWTYVPQPVAAIYLLGMLATACYTYAFRRLHIALRILLSGSVVAILATTTAFLFHSVFVHSHMFSALYLFGMLLAIYHVLFQDERGPTGWLVAAGVMASGLTLARPDGFAYVVIGWGALLLGAAIRQTWVRPALAFFSAHLALLAAAYLPAFYELGSWGVGTKLSGSLVMVFLLLATAMPALFYLVSRSRPVTRFLASTDAVVAVFAGLNLIVLAGVAVWQLEQFAEAISMAGQNLLWRGGYNSLWPFLAGVVALTIASRYARRRRGSVLILYSVLQFFAIALVVHGATHPGRLGWGDSFSRVAFHIVPVIFWLLAESAGSLIDVARGDRQVPESLVERAPEVSSDPIVPG